MLCYQVRQKSRLERLITICAYIIRIMAVSTLFKLPSQMYTCTRIECVSVLEVMTNRGRKFRLETDQKHTYCDPVMQYCISGK